MDKNKDIIMPMGYSFFSYEFGRTLVNGNTYHSIQTGLIFSGLLVLDNLDFYASYMRDYLFKKDDKQNR